MTWIDFDAGEIFSMAIDIERNGAAFYRKAAAVVASDESKVELLEQLARWELDHEKFFTRLAGELSAHPGSTESFAPDEETVRYLQAFADEQVLVFTRDPSDVIEEDADPEEILRLAIGIEKDSIAFYTGILHAVRRPEEREGIEKIIHEEMHHVGILAGRLKSMLSRHPD